MSFKTEITQEWLLGLTTALATMDDHDVRVRWQNMYKEQIFADVSFYVESASLSTVIIHKMCASMQTADMVIFHVEKKYVPKLSGG